MLSTTCATVLEQIFKDNIFLEAEYIPPLPILHQFYIIVIEDLTILSYHIIVTSRITKIIKGEI